MQGGSDRPSAQEAQRAPAQVRSVDDLDPRYRHVYVSPHFDDIALSMGGAVARQRRDGEAVLVVAVFTARPGASLTRFAEFQHERWGGSEAPWPGREAEERAAMADLGADYLWLGYPDAIYRGGQYLSDEDLFGPVKSGDEALSRSLADDIVRVWRRCPRSTLYLPLGVGGHVDHQLCHGIHSDPSLEKVQMLFYEDLPYSLNPGAVEARVAEVAADLQPRVVEIGPAVDAKIRAVQRYVSQVEWIFRHHGRADQALRDYSAGLSAIAGGHAERLWVRSARRAS